VRSSIEGGIVVSPCDSSKKWLGTTRATVVPARTNCCFFSSLLFRQAQAGRLLRHFLQLAGKMRSGRRCLLPGRSAGHHANPTSLCAVWTTRLRPLRSECAPLGTRLAPMVVWTDKPQSNDKRAASTHAQPASSE
jgi:hypothetical protein